MVDLLFVLFFGLAVFYVPNQRFNLRQLRLPANSPLPTQTGDFAVAVNLVVRVVDL